VVIQYVLPSLPPSVLKKHVLGLRFGDQCTSDGNKVEPDLRRPSLNCRHFFMGKRTFSAKQITQSLMAERGAMCALVAKLPEKARERSGARYLGFLLPIALYILGALVFFRWQIFSNFDLAFGGGADIRFVAFIHEHVYRWLNGLADFLSPPFFFNQTNALGYSDAFILDQLIYAPLRVLGADSFLALSLVAIILSAIAYFFLYLVLRRLNVSVALASLAALIFTFSNNLYLKSWHFQHFAVYYLPIITYCGLFAIVELRAHPIRAYLLGAFAGVLYGLLFSSAYYVAWFFGLALLVFAPIVGYMAWPQVRAWWRPHPRRVVGLGCVASVSFIVAVSLFAVIYAPVLALGAARNFDEYLHYAPQPIDILNVGKNNLVWSGLIRRVHLIPDGQLGFNELSIALTPVIQILLVASAIISFRPRFWSADATGRVSRAVVVASAGVCALVFIVIVKINRDSLFHLLYVVLPGANAIRVGNRAMIIANLFAVTAISLTCQQAFRLVQEPHIIRSLIRSSVLGGLLFLAAIEQVNLAQPAQLSRKDEREHLRAVGRAPRECKAFYAAPQEDALPEDLQVDAMVVAQAQNLPTLNGYSGIKPPGWDLGQTDSEDYEQRVLRWALHRRIAEGLCRLAIDSGNWSINGH
jgi:hypothetical protein